MRFDIITLFPELFSAHLAHGVTRRAYQSLLQVCLWPLREHTDDPYRRVDDRPYGGGPGMVMLAEPLLRALQAVQAARSDPAAGPAGPRQDTGPVPVVHFTPTGVPLTQAIVREFASGPGAVLICGRYEGIDQRFLDRRVTHELSLGDFVLSGGELPALALLDAVARLQPGVLQPASHEQDSFSDGLLEGPAYSRPETLALDGAELRVPDVLLSGHHGEIARWRRQRALELTARRRPDLLARARAGGQLSARDEQFLASLGL